MGRQAFKKIYVDFPRSGDCVEELFVLVDSVSYLDSSRGRLCGALKLKVRFSLGYATFR